MGATSASFEAPAVGAVSTSEPFLPAMARGNVLTVAGMSWLVIVSVVLFGLGGWEYYQAPLDTRASLPEHLLLRPSGPVGVTLGVAGLVSMLMTLPYAVRKRWRAPTRLRTMKRWLEVHVFCGIVGPVLITLHTSFTFEGLASVGYWLMMTVWASGFIGRYLYVRIPRTVRGEELSLSQVGETLARIQQQVEARPLPSAVQQELHDFDLAVAPASGPAPGALDLFFGELQVRARLMLLRRRLRAANVDVEAISAIVDRVAERSTLARRLVHLERTRHLFELWRVFHQPLVYGLFVIVALHVTIALYFA